MNKYKINIQKRQRENILDTLLKDHIWRESTKDLYDEIIFNFI